MPCLAGQFCLPRDAAVVLAAIDRHDVDLAIYNPVLAHADALVNAALDAVR